MTTLLTKAYKFSAIHRLAEACGRSESWHGHDYKVEVTLKVQVDTESGLGFARHTLDNIVQTHLLSKFDGSSLNQHWTHPSGENLCQEFFAILKHHIGTPLYRVSLQETRKNRFVCVTGSAGK